MRNAFAEAFVEAARHDERLCMVVADLSAAGAMDEFRAQFPERFVNVGVAEQAMIGLAAGMAAMGRRPFAYTIAPFALYRPFEFVRDDLCYQHLPVTVVGMGAGLSYSTLGSTHHAQEDVAIACAVPGLRVLAPCDPQETRLITRWCAEQADGPTYLRIGKAGERELTADAEPLVPGKVRFLRRTEDAYAVVIGYGPILELAIDADADVVAVHSLKPLDEAGIEEVLRRYRRVLVLEEMGPRGGLGDQVKRIAFDMRAGCRIDCMALRDEFVHCYGSRGELLAAHGLSAGEVAVRA